MKFNILFLVLSIVVTSTIAISLKVTNSQLLEPNLNDDSLLYIGDDIFVVSSSNPLSILKRQSNGEQKIHVFPEYGQTYSDPVGFTNANKLYLYTWQTWQPNYNTSKVIEIDSTTMTVTREVVLKNGKFEINNSQITNFSDNANPDWAGIAHGGVSYGNAYFIQSFAEFDYRAVKLSLSSFTVEYTEIEFFYGWVLGSAIVGDYLYTTDSECGIRKYNLKNFTDSELYADIPDPNSGNGACSQLISHSGNCIFSKKFIN